MPQITRAGVPTLLDAEAAGKTSDVDLNQQLLIELAGGDGLTDVPVRDVPLYDVPVPDVPLPKVCPDGSVGEKSTRPSVADETMVVAFRVGSGRCLVRGLCCNLFSSGIDYYTRREVFGSLKVYFVSGF